MFTTVVLVLACGIVLIAQIVLWLIMLTLGARWAKIPGVTTGRALLVALIVYFGQTSFGVASVLYEPKAFVQAIAALIAVGVVIGLPVVVIRRILQVSWWQAFRVWLPTQAVSLIFGLLLVFLVIRPFFCEAFKIPTNSMAPTILGVHLTDVCPTCGKAAFGSPPREHDYPHEPLMICEGFHVHPSKTASEPSDGDRILVMKILRPRRWDLIAFRYPGDPTINHIKRLVGLPGEEVFIKEGSVWINGQRLEPPLSLQGLKYVTEFPNLHFQSSIWGTVDRPAKLGEGEYFVLGDFSQESSDSRLWQTGAPGHPIYAVPESYIFGAVTHIYWPPSRWRIVR
ncbi:MAG: signal peptidase I [Thermoguttaceae bacterium]|jgi:signal peptidase I